MGNSCNCLGKKNQPQKKTNVPSKQNTILDRFTPNQLSVLEKLYNQYRTRGQGIQYSKFIEMMPAIKDFPTEIKKSVFQEFDKENEGQISWKSLCLTVGQSFLGSREEKANFLFDVFDFNRDGILESDEQHQLQIHCSKILKTQSENIFVNLQRYKKRLEKDIFSQWAINNIDIHKAINPFEIIASPISERNLVQDLIANKKQIKEGDKAFLITQHWWEAWKRFVNFDQSMTPFYDQEPQLVAIRSSSIVIGAKPIEINNNNLVDPTNQTKLLKNLVENRDYQVLLPEIWDLFQQWYGGGPTIEREYIQIDGRIELELYPIIVKVYLQDGKSRSYGKKQFILKISKLADVSSVIERIKAQLRIQEEGTLWINTKQEMIQIKEGQKLIDLYDQIDEASLLFEIRGRKNSQASMELNNDYEAGDQIEFLTDNGEWKPGRITFVQNQKFVINSLWGKMHKFTIKNQSRLRNPAREQIQPLSNTSIAGLQNIGNTCYMNAAIQCLIQTPLLGFFFQEKGHEKLLRSRQDSIALEFGRLVRNIYNCTNSLSPNIFRMVFTREYELFAGYEQQDSGEFLRILLDRLNTELTRNIKNFQSVSSYSLENPTFQQEKEGALYFKQMLESCGSIISDLFGGQTKRVIDCNICNYKRVIFEQFLDVSLPIPVNQNETQLQCKIVPQFEGNIQISKFCIQNNVSFNLLKATISEISGIQAADLILYTVQNGAIQQVFDSKNFPGIFEIIGELVAIEARKDEESQQNPAQEMQDHSRYLRNLKNGQLIDLVNDKNQVQTVQVHKVKSGYIKVKTQEQQKVKVSDFSLFQMPRRKQCLIQIQHIRQSFNKIQCFGIPLIFYIDNRQSLKNLHKQVYWLIQRFIKQEQSQANLPCDQYQLYLFDKFSLDCTFCGSNCTNHTIPFENTMICAIKGFENSMICIYWKQFSYKFSENYNILPSQSYSIYSCMAEFSKEENIDLKCNCKDKVQVNSHIEVSELADILIIQLKRFQFSNGNLEKITNLIEFPLNNLDAKELIKESKIDAQGEGITVSTVLDNELYDLYAVINHTGNVNSGHYTAYCYSIENGEWLFFDDSRVYRVVDEIEKEVVTAKAYILFYKRKRFKSSNLVNYKSI